jgi:hypothetical protein
VQCAHAFFLHLTGVAVDNTRWFVQGVLCSLAKFTSNSLFKKVFSYCKTAFLSQELLCDILESTMNWVSSLNTPALFHQQLVEFEYSKQGKSVIKDDLI